MTVLAIQTANLAQQITEKHLRGGQEKLARLQEKFLQTTANRKPLAPSGSSYLTYLQVAFATAAMGSAFIAGLSPLSAAATVASGVTAILRDRNKYLALQEEKRWLRLQEKIKSIESQMETSSISVQQLMVSQATILLTLATVVQKYIQQMNLIRGHSHGS